jgi:hypothetical protein
MTRFRRRGPQVLAAAAASVLALSAVGAVLAEGKTRLADCRIESERKVVVNGKCRFTPDEGGSFTLEHADPKRTIFFSEIMSVTVSVISPGVAEVRGLTRQGINSRWGEAKRSAQDRACWQGDDFKICAR